MRVFNFARLLLDLSNDTDVVYPLRAPVLTKCILFISIFSSGLLVMYFLRYFITIYKIIKDCKNGKTKKVKVETKGTSPDTKKEQ